MFPYHLIIKYNGEKKWILMSDFKRMNLFDGQEGLQNGYHDKYVDLTLRLGYSHTTKPEPIDAHQHANLEKYSHEDVDVTLRLGRSIEELPKPAYIQACQCFEGNLEKYNGDRCNITVGTQHRCE